MAYSGPSKVVDPVGVLGFSEQKLVLLGFPRDDLDFKMELSSFWKLKKSFQISQAMNNHLSLKAFLKIRIEEALLSLQAFSSPDLPSNSN